MEEELLEVALRVAEQAAGLLRSRPADLEAAVKSSPTDAVTVMDRRAEQVILAGLAEARPDDRIIAEESGRNDAGGRVTWYVDPLDGTVNYLYGIPQYAVSVAAAVDGETVAGVVVDVAHERTYLARKGGGAWAEGVRLRCTSVADPALSLVATGFDYAAAQRAGQGRVVGALLPRVRDIRRLGSAALDLCAVASGQVDAYYEAARHEWDWRAGALIAEEAGANVGGIAGQPAGAGILLAANPALYAALDPLLTELSAGDASLPS